MALIDVAPLLDGSDVAGVAAAIDDACRSLGFFRVTGHGVDPELLARMSRLARAFFELDDAAKQPYAMTNAGPAWRG